MLSLSLVWDLSDRFALLTEVRGIEENDFGNIPYEFKGGLAYRFTPDVQLAVYGGVAKNETDVDDEEYNSASVRLSVQF
jgi:hypothetical protein